jgi:hypothetical protein
MQSSGRRAINFKAIGEFFGKKSFWEDLGKTSVSSFEDDLILVLTFPKNEKTRSLSTQLFALNGKQSRYMFYFKSDSK